MTSKIIVKFQVNTPQPSRIKNLSLHPIKKWIGLINDNNTFSLWNYQQKILIKSFSCTTLDDTKQIDIKDIIFFDKHVIHSIENGINMNNNIVFVTGVKLILYDYITDAIKYTNEKDLQQKSIKKVCVYSYNKLCVAMNDGNYKIVQNSDIQGKGLTVIKTIRGYHNKPICWIFAYYQNYNETPRVITASDQDGLMACWNIEMILKNSNNNQISIPCFKFQSHKKGKETIGSQEILYLQYDSALYKLITLNQQYIRLWSTMTGLQVKRIKNLHRFKQIGFFNHFSYPSDSFVAHSKGSRVFIAQTNLNNQIIMGREMELKNLFTGFNQMNGQEQHHIVQVISTSQHPSEIFVLTTFNMAILEIDKFYHSLFGCHHAFLTRMSTINSRQLVNRSQGALLKNLTPQTINGLKFQEDILTNSFFLSTDQENMYFNLIEVQYSTMLHETRKYKIFTFSLQSPLRLAEGRSNIVINFEGNQFIIFNKTILYYEVYAAINEHEAQDLLNNMTDIQNRIDFYSKFELVCSGYARDIVYHQFRQQFAVIAGFDDRDQLFQMKNDKKLMKKQDSMPSKYAVLIYQKIGPVYKIVQKSEYYTSKGFRIFGFGGFYGYSKTKDGNEIIEHISGEKSYVREIEGCLSSSEQVYVSFCENFYILSYDKYFIVLKLQQNGSMTYYRTFQHTILHGYFWQKFFFFLTERSLYFMHILNEDCVIIKVADSSRVSLIQKIINDIEDDDFEPECELLSVGQQQIMGIVNMSLVLLSESGNSTLISLLGFPYIVFCLEVAAGVSENSKVIYKNASKNIQAKMKELMTNYGIIAPDST